MSLDGYIATKDDGLDWLNAMQLEGEDYGYSEMQKRVDTYIVGRATYEIVLGLTGGKFPQAEMYDCYVITRKERAPENGVQFYNGDLEALIQSIKAKPGKDIYCDGGGQIVKLLMEKDLIDEYIISVIPILLGDGKPLFIGGTPPINIEFVSSKSFDSGLVQLRYIRS